MPENNNQKYLPSSEVIQYLNQHGLDLTPKAFPKFRMEHQLRAHVKKDQQEKDLTLYFLQSDLDIILATISQR